MKNIKSNEVFVIVAISLIGVFTGLSIFFETKKQHTKQCGEQEILLDGACQKTENQCNIERGVGTSQFSGEKYEKCVAIQCESGYILSNGICRIKFSTGYGITENTYGTHYLELGGMYSRDHNIKDYKRIKINKKIDSVRVFITIDFPPRFKEKFPSYTQAENFGFAVKYFLGEQGFSEEGGFYNVLRNNTCETLINDKKKGFNGRIAGKKINGGYTWIIDLSNNVIIASEKCELGKQYTTTRSLDFINKHIGKSLYIGGYLSHVGEGKGHGPIKGWEVSLVKNIRIEYIGDKDALSLGN